MSCADPRALAAIHELRGPLSAISLALSLARRRGRLTPGDLDGLELELERAARALRELEALHSPARALTCEDRGWVKLDKLISDTVGVMQGLAVRHGAALGGVWSGPCASVWGDRVALSAAVGNLIANALEHGQGPVLVHGRLCGPVARLQISDCGPGLPASVAALIDPAAGVEDGQSGACDGPGDSARGWGLRIAAELVARHGGRLGAAPSAKGARLVLELPARPTRALQQAPCDSSAGRLRLV
jgi:signal transduction histidine kinase